MYKTGKLPPKNDYRTLRFSQYVTPALPPPPASHDVLGQVYNRLHEYPNPTVLFPMDGNDRLGDCTIAALAHADTVYDGLVGNRSIMPEADVVSLYLNLSGGADNGLNCLDVLKYWRKIKGDSIIAFAKLNPLNHTHVMQAISIFGGVYLGFHVQQNVFQDFDARIPWTPGTLTPDGHCVFATGYDEQLVNVLTWGNTQQGTWDWWDECVDEAYALLPVAAQTTGFAPGFDFETLRKDLGSVTN